MEPIKCECGFWDRDRPHSRVGGGVCEYQYRRRNGRIDNTGDIAIPDEVVDLTLLLGCRRERDEARAEVERLEAALRGAFEITLAAETERDKARAEVERLRAEVGRLK